MLDLIKLAQQMQGIGQHLSQEATSTRQRLERAQQLLIQAQARQSELVESQTYWHDRFNFTAAVPIESLGHRGSIAPPPAAHTVIATDGSQIAPSHHEIAYCYLINVGRIILHYGQSKLPLLDSLPEVFYRPEDLYLSQQWGIRTEEWMGYRRTVSEAVVLAELAQALREDPPQKARTTQHPPSLALVDGSLIYWFLDPLPAEARDRILQPILTAWEQLRSCGMPLVGYVSASRSGEALNFLRLQSCPYLAPDCATHCVTSGATQTASPDLAAASDQRSPPSLEKSGQRFPCQVLDPLRDTALWAHLLSPGQRSPLWRSSARIQDFYGEQAIYFCYVHVGSEIARVEVPSWVAQDPHLLNSALSLTLAQVQKGYGYPVALAEAHNQAVVRGGDRARFFALLEQQMIKAGLRNVGTSYKETRKRGSIA